VTAPWRPAGTANFRDLGGLPTEDGGRIRSGLLFRSDTLQELTAADVDVLVRRMRLRLIVDLRASGEVAGEGRGLLEAEPVRHVNLALHSRDQRPIPDLTADTLVQHYLGYLTVSAAAAAEAFRLLAGDGLPAVVHCAAGKDRTGVMAGLVLRAVGVPVDMVAADYARSADAVPSIIARLRRLPAYADRIDLLPPEVHECRAETMMEFLRAVDEQYGSVAAFLREAGLEDEVVRRLRDRLVDRPGATAG
jgi:protein tyrosine/serine phosphatase